MRCHQAIKPMLTSSRVWKKDRIIKRFLPKGCSIDIIQSKALMDAEHDDLDEFDKEHIIPYFWRKNLEVYHPVIETQHKFISVDTPRDYEKLVKNIYD